MAHSKATSPVAGTTKRFSRFAMVACFAIVWPHAAPGANLLGLVDTGELFISSDGGVTWTVRSTLPLSDAIAIAATSTTDELILVSETGSVYRSADAGLNWNAVGTVAASDVVDMAVRPNGDVVLLTRAGTLWRSSDGGTTFTSLATLTASNHTSIGEDDSDNLFVLTRTGEVSRSTDEGTTWNAVGVITTSDAVEIRAMGADLFVSTGTGDIAKSTDHGTTWTFVGTISQINVTSLTNLGSDLVVTTKEGLIASSSDDGVSWTWAGSINQIAVVAIGSDTPLATGIGASQPPARFSLRPPWPNPAGADPVVNVTIEIPSAGGVSLALYDATGRRVATRPNEMLPTAGDHAITWALPPLLPSGVYFLRATTMLGERAQHKLVITR